MTENKIRPGIRAAASGIAGVVGGYYFNSSKDWIRFKHENGGFGAASISSLTPLPFRPGDRVDMGGGIFATVVVCDMNQDDDETVIHFDGSREIRCIKTDYLTLIDYPGKEAE